MFLILDHDWPKRSIESDSNGFYWDTFSGGFGGFQTMRKKSSKKKSKMDPELKEHASFISLPFEVRIKKSLETGK